MTPVPDSHVSLDDRSNGGGGSGGGSRCSESSSRSARPNAAVVFFGAVANLCSATLGAGVLSLPFAMYQAGLVCGVLLLLVSAWATSVSIELLIKACDMYRLATYEQVVEHCLGRRARSAVEVSILLFCVGCAVAYVIAVGDILEHIGHMPQSTRKLAMASVWVFAMLPLSCLKRMQSLQFASTVGIISIGTLLVAATAHLLHPGEGHGMTIFEMLGTPSLRSLRPFIGPLNGSWMSVLRACPIVLFAFSCQVNVCQIYDEMPVRGDENHATVSTRAQPEAIEAGNDAEGETTNLVATEQQAAPQPGCSDRAKTMKLVAWTAVGICCLLYMSISLVTLIDFGNEMKPNVLSCYDLNGREALLHVAFVAMAVAVVMAFPLNVFPARVSVLQIVSHSMSVADETQTDPAISSDPMCIRDEEARQPLLHPTDSTEPVQLGYMDRDSAPGECNALSRHDEILEVVPNTAVADGGTVMGDGLSDLKEVSLLSHMAITLLVSGGALVLALVLPNISVVFGLLGGTTSSLLGFIVPGLLGLNMDRRDARAWILVVAGTVVGVLTTGVTIISTIQDL